MSPLPVQAETRAGGPSLTGRGATEAGAGSVTRLAPGAERPNRRDTGRFPAAGAFRAAPGRCPMIAIDLRAGCRAVVDR